MIGDILQPTHLLFILVIALLVLGPKRLPEVGRSLGRGLRDFKGALSGDDDGPPEAVPSQTTATGAQSASGPVVHEPAPGPVVHEPASGPVVHEPAPGPVVHEPALGPVHEPAPEPVHEPAPEPVHEPEPEPAQPAPERVEHTG